MKISMVLSGETIQNHKEDVLQLLGEQTDVNFKDVEKLTVNYKIDLPNSKDMLRRLRAVLDLAEKSISFDLDMEEIKLLEYSESVKLMHDLVSASDKRRNADLWND